MPARFAQATRWAFAALLTSAAAALAQIPHGAAPSPINVVAIGASNTWGWGVFGRSAYPERLEDLLRAEGHDVRVRNAGMVFDTTAGMLRRLDRAVPQGTRLVVLQPGGNDRRFYVSPQQRSANIETMVRRLRGRGIAVIVYDPVFPPDFYQWDRIHINAAGHGKIASDLKAQIATVLGLAQR